MQARAIFEAAIESEQQTGAPVIPEVMVPLIGTAREFDILKAQIDKVAADVIKETGGKLPLIGVGGVSNAADAYAKIKAGASAVQLYTAMVYGGLSLAPKIAKDLDRLLEENGFASVHNAVGTKRGDWL